MLVQLRGSGTDEILATFDFVFLKKKGEKMIAGNVFGTWECRFALSLSKFTFPAIEVRENFFFLFCFYLFLFSLNWLISMSSTPRVCGREIRNEKSSDILVLFLDPAKPLPIIMACVGTF